MDNLKALTQVDANLLTVFQAIDDHRNVSRAARALGLSQSAVSHALARLRTTFDDALFVKTSLGMAPTARATVLRPLVRKAVTDLGALFLGETVFEPATLARTFRIRTTDLIEHLLLPGLVRTLTAVAPHASVSMQALGFGLPRLELERGDCNLAIAGFFGKLPAGFYQQKLYSDGFRSCVRRKHPRVQNRLTLAAFVEHPHILIAPGGELTGRIDAILKRKTRRRRIVAGTSGFLAAGWGVAESDAILTAPERLIRSFETYLPIISFPTPIELPPIDILQVWHARTHDEPAERWFRQQVRDLAVTKVR
jgi:DNA-binding transcriptional LysR family regulator